ncbi:unnamed protein product [Spirodela intermedia]|uniref:RRM domain-containing protein n=1 Tax=Spirodela intermedia TaxID=51605 RepID=A0A7I8J1W5_SPIIN|nr:unnamed protein product [Spirodela intermedia]CAA6664127.1 unnamed protein product [Spirodela intermedia]
MSGAPVFKATAILSKVDGCLTALPAHFLPESRHPFLASPARHIGVHLAQFTSPPSSVPLPYLSRRAPFVSFVWQTSGQAQQTEVGGEEAVLSEWEGDGESVGVEEVTGWDEGTSEWGKDDGEESLEKGDKGALPEPPEDAKLFVGNLPYDMDSEMLAQLFEQAGIVEVAEVIYNRETDQSRGFGFVTMSSVEEAEKAIQTLNRHYIEGRLLTVNKAAPRGSRPERSQSERTPRGFEPRSRIYVGNLPWSVDEARLEQVFSEYGKVVETRVVYDRESGRSRGFAFLTMTIRVNAAEEKPRRGSF